MWTLPLHWGKQQNLHDRLSEHLSLANNPIAPSYNDEAMAVHYRQKHREKQLRERSHMTSAAKGGGGGFEMLTVADKGGRGSKPCWRQQKY